MEETQEETQKALDTATKDNYSKCFQQRKSAGTSVSHLKILKGTIERFIIKVFLYKRGVNSATQNSVYFLDYSPIFASLL